jgi:hypothetical protein
MIDRACEMTRGRLRLCNVNAFVWHPVPIFVF